MTRCLGCVAVGALLIVAAPATRVSTQTRHASGQDVGPTYEGWERNADGTSTLYFGYFNRNSAEELDIPIGPQNTIDPGGDRGQPTHFYVGRRWWVFKVVVPVDWPKDKRVVWTVTSHGMTNQAKGWLQPEYEVDQGVIRGDSGLDPFLMSVGGGGEADFENAPPSITGSGAQTIALSNVLTLTATATDDGRPKPVPDPTGRRQPGVRMRWIVYRGSADAVKFEPDIMSQRVYGKPVTLESKVTFSAPGSYRLRAIASDGQAFSTYDVDVTVK